MKSSKIKEIETIIQSIKSNNVNTFLGEQSDDRSCYIMRKKDNDTLFDDVHDHEVYEILYVSSGTLSYIIEGIHYELSEGDLLLIPPFTLHKLNKLITPNSKRYILNFTEEYATKLSTSKCDLNKAFEIASLRKTYKIPFGKTVGKSLEKYFNAMVDLQFSKEYGSDLSFNVRFCLAMILVNGAMFNLKSEDSIVNDSNNKVVSAVVEYINENYNKPLPIQSIAKNFSLSSSRIAHLFKEETGLSIHQFIIKKRLIHAKEFIRNGEHINIVYALCGFNDNTSFFRAFKKEFDITPKKYYQSYKLATE